MRLKHLLSVFLMLMTCSVGNVWGADPSVTISVSSDTWTATGYSGGDTNYPTSVTKSGITVSSTKGYKDGTNHIREYQNSVITISSTVGNIKSIAFTCTAQNNNDKGPGKLAKNSSGGAGTYEYSGYVGTWSFGTGTSNVSSVQLKATAQCRWTQVVVTYVGSDCSKPTVGSSLSSVSSTENSITATVPISATGGCNITENGLVYSTTASTPTVGGSGCIKETVTACGATAANKSVTISGLNCGTNYYVRGYATNSSGTSYTNVTTRSTSDCPKYTVTLMDDDTELEQATAGASVNLPTRDGCTGYTFAGWTKTWVAPQSSWTTTAPTIIPAGSYTPTNNENLYPVYTKTEEGGGTAFARYEKVTSAPSDWSGKYLLSTGTYTATGGYASKHLSCTSFTPATTENTDYEFVLTKVGTTGYSIKFPGNSTSYLGYSSSTDFATSTSTPTSSSSSYLWTPSTTNISNVGSASRKLSTKADNTDIRPYENVPSGGALICLYKRIEENASTTYYISLPTCCTPLAHINGSVSQTNPTTAVLSWDAIANVSAWTVKYRTHGNGDWTTFNGDINTANNRKSATITTACGTKYDYEIIATPASNYCAVDTVLNNNGDGFDAGKYAITINDMTGGSVTPSVSSACSGTNNVTLTIAASEGKEIDVLTVDGSNVTASIVNNQYTFSMPTHDVAVSATFKNQASPVISLSKDALAFSEQEVSVASEGMTFKVYGVSLGADVTWALSGTNTSDFSVSPASPIAKASAEDEKGVEMTVTFTPSSAGAKSATLTFSSTGAQNKAVTLTGTGVNLYTVTFNAGAGTCGTASLKQASNGASVTLPTVTAPAGMSFIGWAETSVAETATLPTTVASPFTPSGDDDLYAVYEFLDGNEAEFVKVTALNELATGDRVVVVSNGTNKYTLATDNEVIKINAASYTADANNKISVSENKHIWILGGGTSDVYTFTNSATHTTLGASAQASNNSTAPISLSNSNNEWLIKIVSGYILIKNNAGASYLETTGDGFCIYGKSSDPSGNALTNYYQMFIFKGTAIAKYATSPKVVSSIAVKTAPTTTKYRVGDVFDAEGTELTVNYSEGDPEVISEGFTYEVNNLSEGKLTSSSNTVTYTYKGKTTTQTISAGTLESIAITTAPTKVNYGDGESFDATGMAVKAVFSNELEVADVTGFTYSTDAMSAGTTTVTISYTYEGETKTAYQTISVGSLSSIAVTTAPTKTAYTELDAFDATGMVVTATYSNGYSKAVTGYTVTPNPVTYPCSQVTITYEGQTTTQDVTVSEAAKYTVHFWTNGTDNQRQVIQGNTLTDIPTPAAVDGFTFMGWASAELEETSNEPASYALSKYATSYTPNADDVAFYAVYRRSEESVKNGFKLSVTYSNTTYYVGAYYSNSYFYAVTDAANAEVYFFDEPNYIYGYDSYGKKYIKVYSSSTSIDFVANKTNASYFTITESDGLFTFTDGRKFAFNKNQKDRFASYDVSGDDSKFTKTAAQKVVSEYLYSTSAVVPVLQSIAVTTAPTKTEYFEGDDFEADGMVVTGTFNTGAKVLTASQYTISPTENLEAGTTSVTIAAVADNTITTTQEITVNAIVLTSIEITTAPTKTVYVVGQNFDPTGMVVTAHYNDNSKDKAVTGYTMTPSTSTALTAEDDHIEISYTEGGVTKTANQAITVNAALTGIEITTEPTKMTYIETETFDATGMVVTAHYNGSDDQIVTASVTWDKTGVLAALNSLENSTVETITFTYEESGAEVTTTLNVTVNPYPRYTVTFSANGTPTNVTETAGQGGVTVPANPSAVGDYTFAGWSKSQRSVESADDPALVTITAGKYYPAGAETLYAVYTMDKEDEVAGMLLSIDNGEEDDIYVGSFNDKQFTDAANAESALPLWFKDGLLFYMNGTTPTYVSNSTSGKTDLTASTSKPNSAQWVRSEANGKVMFQSTTNNTRYLAHNTSPTYFRAYGDSYAHEFTVTTSSAVATFEIPFYTTAPSADVTPAISFAEASKTITVVDANGALNTCTNALTTNSTGSVSYASSDETVATVAANGTVSVKKVGEVTITANVAAVAGTWKAVSKSYTLTVEKATASASFGEYQTIPIVYKNNTIALPATSAQAITITYSCSNPEYATVDASGNVTGIATTFGTNNQRQVTIYANWAETDYYYASTNSTRGSQKVNIKNNAKTQTLSFTDEAKDFGSDQGDKVYTNTLSGAKTTVTYSSSDDNVAEVDENTGEVTVHTNNVGTATITASAAAENVIEDGITFAYGSASKYYTITINYPEPTISVVSCEIKAPISVELSHDNAAMLMYTLDGSTPSYASNNGEIYDDPIVINDTKTLKAIAVSANEDESLVAEAVYTKITPTVTCNVEDGGSVPAGNGAVSLTAADDVLITYELRNGANTVLASGSDVHSPISLDVTMGSGYKLTILSQWDCENGFSSDVEEITFKATGAGLLPINYSDNTTNLPVYFTPTGLGNYSGDGVNTKIKFSNSGHKLVVQFANEPAKLSYTLKLNGDGTDYVFTVEESANGTIYTTLKEHNSSNNALSSEETTFSNIELASTTRYIRWTYTTKPSGTNIGLGNISITASSTGTITIDGVNVTEVPNDFHGNVTVVNGGTFDVSEDKTLENLTVEAGGKVSGSAALTVNDFTIEGTHGKSGQVMNAENLHVDGEAYFDFTLGVDVSTPEGAAKAEAQWHNFSVPFPVSATSGVYGWRNNQWEQLTNEVDYAIEDYHGELRKNGEYGWKKFRSIMTPGHTYSMTVNGDIQTYRFKKVAGDYTFVAAPEVEFYQHAAAEDKNAGWNGLGNMRLCYSSINNTNIAETTPEGQSTGRYVLVLDAASYTYKPYALDKINLTVGSAFFIQASADGTMGFNEAQATVDKVYAPARTQAKIAEPIMVTMSGERGTDHMYISADEDATSTYQIGRDMQRMFASSNPTTPLIYTMNYGNLKLAAEDAPLVNDQAVYTLQLYAPIAGEYTLSTEAVADADVYLTYEGAIIWNISESEYTVDLNKGKNDSYGLKLVKKAPSVVTGVDQIDAKAGAQKVIIDEHVYILRGGQMYDVNGKLVK